MSDNRESRLRERLKDLETELNAATMRSARALERYGFALDAFRDDCIETMDRYGDHKLEVGVLGERARVFKLWLSLYESLAEGHDEGMIRSTVIDDMLTLGGRILDSSEGLLSVAQYDCVERRPPDAKSVEPVVDDELVSKVVKLMAMAGTQRQGILSGWTIGDIQHGLKTVMPEVQFVAIKAALTRLGSDGIVENFPGTNAYCLVDDYSERLKGLILANALLEEPKVGRWGAFLRSLEEVLRSNKDAHGKLVSWKTSALFYALHDCHPWITKADIVAAAACVEWCKEVAPGVYQFVEVPSVTAQNVLGSTPEPESKYREAHIDDVTPAGIVEAADAIYRVLATEASGGQRRIWKEYDIIGLLGRGVELGGNFKDEYLSQEVLTAAMDFLVVEGKLEAVPTSPERPWIKQPGWRVK